MRKSGIIALGFGIACAGAAIAQPPVLTKLEVVGNYAGRLMKLTVDGELQYEGRGQLHPPGMTWTINVLPGETPASLTLELEPCEAPFVAELPRNGATHALIISGCDTRLAKG